MVTDDTEMSVALLTVLSQNNWIYDRKSVIIEYLNWVNGYLPDNKKGKSVPYLGKNIRSLFYGIKTYEGYIKRSSKIFENGENLQSNECLMRCLPLLVSVIESRSWNCVEEDVYLTNPNKTCSECVKLYLFAVLNLLQNSNTKDVYSIIISIMSPSLKKKFDSFSEEKVAKADRWVVCAFWIALESLRRNYDLNSAMKWIIEMKGDTDTNGAVCLGLLGAIYKVDDEKIKAILECDSSATDIPRPERWHPKQYLQIIQK